jgi:hypothetical protein
LFKLKIDLGEENTKLLNSDSYTGKNIKEAVPLIKSELKRNNSGKDVKFLHIKVINWSF